MIAKIASIALALIFALTGFLTHASAATAPVNHQGWIIQNNEAYRLKAAGEADSFQFVLCRSDQTSGNLMTLPCKPGETPDFTNYYTLRTAIRNGLEGYALFDIEGWTYTPKYQSANEPYWVCQAAKLAKSAGVRLIEAPVTSRTAQPSVEADAARCGAWGVELQYQFAKADPNLYHSLISGAVTAIHKTGRKPVIIAGIGVDSGGTPAPAATVYKSYLSVRSLVGGRFWLNLPIWKAPVGKGCATTGCTDLTKQFLALVDGS